MASSTTLISNPVTNSDRARESSNKKKKMKKKSQNQTQCPNETHNSIPWKSESQQQIYSSKLLQALRGVRPSSAPTTTTTPTRRGRAVREAADRVLADTAKGRTRWSRAILTNRLKLKFMKSKRQRATVTGDRPSKKPRVSVLRLRTKSLPAFRRKTRVLGRLVPGCRRETLPVILEEATDYIAALEMQVRAMAALAELLSGSGSGSPAVSQLGLSRPSTS